MALLIPGVRAGTGAETPIDDLLQRAGREAEKLLDRISGVTCRETVDYVKLDGRMKTVYEERVVYDSLVMPAQGGAGVSIDESREELEHKTRKARAPLLLTRGFSLLSLVFHPAYQSSFEFSQLPAGGAAPDGLIPIAFKYVKGQSPSVLVLSGREYPLPWRGVAWVRPESGAPVRIQAGIGDSLVGIGLAKLEADVQYSEIRFSGAGAPYMLPSLAVIEADTKQQRWRNTHAYSSYRLFNVETREETAPPK